MLPPCAGRVVHHYGLTQRLAHALAHDARERIGGPPAENGTTIVIGRDG
jgi:hypothetical protein